LLDLPLLEVGEYYGITMVFYWARFPLMISLNVFSKPGL
jgi:hypothetical protein